MQERKKPGPKPGAKRKSARGGGAAEKAEPPLVKELRLMLEALLCAQRAFTWSEPGAAVFDIASDNMPISVRDTEMLMKKVKRGGFPSVAKFSSDLTTIFANCREYNEGEPFESEFGAH